jgi:hypothetical protein
MWGGNRLVSAHFFCLKATLTEIAEIAETQTQEIMKQQEI